MKVTVSGPGYDETREGAAPGLSLAITFANRATISRTEATYYVRAVDGTTLGRAESDGHGGVKIYGPEHLVDRATREALL